jgi:hypothetical protein
LGADSAFLRATLQRRRAYLVTLLNTRGAYQLINRGHDYSYSCRRDAMQRPLAIFSVVP